MTYVTGKVVDSGLGKHGVVLELRLAKRRSVARDDDELGLSGTDGLLLEVSGLLHYDIRRIYARWSTCNPK